MLITSTLLSKFTRAFAFAALITGFVACKKDHNNPPQPAPAAVKLKEFKNGDEFFQLTYNTDGSVQKVKIKSELNTGNEVIDYLVSYGVDKKISSLESTTGQKIVPVYTNNVLSRADLLIDGERAGYTNYHYENGILKKATIYVGQDPDYEPLLEFDYTIEANGNPSQLLVMMANGIPGQMRRAGHVDFTYDQKSNPLYIHKDLLALFWQGASKNNIVKEEHFDDKMVIEDKFEYTYTYNSNGLPEKAVVKSGIPGQTQTTTNVFYSYQ